MPVPSDWRGIDIRWKCWVAIFCFLFVLPVVNPLSDQGNVSVDKHLFVEIWEHQDGKVISGKPHKMMIDFPTYRLENSTLKSMIYFEADPLTQAILGKGTSLSGDLGGGAASGLISVKDLPYLIGNYSGLNISVMQIEGDNVTIGLSGRRIVLEPGESWKREMTEDQQIKDSLMRVTTTLTIWNHGQVVLESPSPDQNRQI
jgi:hypothetical protein